MRKMVRPDAVPLPAARQGSDVVAEAGWTLMPLDLARDRGVFQHEHRHHDAQGGPHVQGGSPSGRQFGA